MVHHAEAGAAYQLARLAQNNIQHTARARGSLRAVPDPSRSVEPDLLEDPLSDEEAHAFHVDFMDGDDDPDGAT